MPYTFQPEDDPPLAEKIQIKFNLGTSRVIILRIKRVGPTIE